MRLLGGTSISLPDESLSRRADLLRGLVSRVRTATSQEAGSLGRSTSIRPIAAASALSPWSLRRRPKGGGAREGLTSWLGRKAPPPFQIRSSSEPAIAGSLGGASRAILLSV